MTGVSVVQAATILARMEKQTGAPPRTDEVEALEFFTREDKRQLAQLCQDCGIELARLRSLYAVAEQSVRREPQPAVALAVLLEEIRVLVAARDEAAREAEAAAAADADPDPDRTWLADWLELPRAFVDGVAGERVARIRARADATDDVSLSADLGRLALLAHLMSRRLDVNLARCLGPAELSALLALLGPGASQMERLRARVGRPDVIAALSPDDLPDFKAFLALFSDLDALFTEAAAEDAELLRAQLASLAEIDAAARRRAAALSALAAELDLSDEALAAFHDAQSLHFADRHPLDDVVLTPHQAGLVWFVAGLLMRAVGEADREALLAGYVRRFRDDVAMLDALGQLVGRGGDRGLTAALRHALGLPARGAQPADVEVALQAGDAGAAVVGLRDVPDHYAGKVLLLCRVAYFLLTHGRAAEADSLGHRALRIATREPLSLRAIARLRIEMGQLDEARRVLEAAHRASPDDARTVQMQAEVERRARAAARSSTLAAGA